MTVIVTSCCCWQDTQAVAQTVRGCKATVTHHVAEDEAGVGEFEVLEEAVEFAAVQGAPRAVKVVSRLRLLAGVVVVQELQEDQSQSQPRAVVQTGDSFSRNVHCR